MGRNGLIFLALLAAGLGTAYYIQQDSARPQPQAVVSRELLLPELQGKLEGVTALDVQVPGQPDLRLARKDGVWVLPAKADYPAAGQPVATLLRALAEARKVEAKTANPELHGRVGLAEKGESSEQGRASRLSAAAKHPWNCCWASRHSRARGNLCASMVITRSGWSTRSCRCRRANSTGWTAGWRRSPSPASGRWR